MFIVTNPSQLTAYLRSLRRARGLTQAALGARLGVTTARVSAIERNPGVLSTALLLQVLKVLGARLALDTGTPKAARSRAPSTGEW
ncbi:MAG TPA: helix-turn-helix domain-containing protein [Gemmatimonadaceae bacterium]|nr:helix-turn-helix domain-containing protein [Gemmatimonadaceae bacterium]